MGPTNPEAIVEAMSHPAIQAQINELLQNPQLLDIMINSNPMLRTMGPSARDLIQSASFRQMLTDPTNIRNMARLNGAGFGAGTRPGGFPAPGAVDNNAPTPASQQSAGQQPAGQQPAGEQTAGRQPVNPFATLFSAPGDRAPSPPSNLFGLQMPPFMPPNYNHGSPASTNSAQAGSSHPSSAGQPPQPPHTNTPAPSAAPMEQLMQLLERQRAASGTLNPFAGLFSGTPPTAPSPAANTPPEERYADQLRQLNDMGFFDFDRNVEALRRSGGNVQGAVNQLLGG